MRRAPAIWVQRPLLSAFGLAAIWGALIPFSPGSAAGTGPDLLFCVVIAWVVRSPAGAPVWIILPLGLLADLMLSRLLGLGALGLFAASELVRARASGLRERPFPVEWLTASLAFVLVLGGMTLLLRLAFAEAPASAILARHAIATALAYPLVALGLGWGLGIGAASTPAGAAR